MDDPDPVRRDPLFDAMAASQYTNGSILNDAWMNGRKFLPGDNAMAKVNRRNIGKLEQGGNCFEVMVAMNDVGSEVDLREV
jgi:hypothetical protein